MTDEAEKDGSTEKSEVEWTITNELRMYAADHIVRGSVCCHPSAIGVIADRIDKAHERELAECRKGIEDGRRIDDKVAERFGLVRLPADADGVTINIGDTLVMMSSTTHEIGNVTSIHLYDGNAMVSVSLEDGGRTTDYARFFRHYYRETTVGTGDRDEDPAEVPASRVISEALVSVKMRIDWERMAQDLEDFAKTVRGMAGDAE